MIAALNAEIAAGRRRVGDERDAVAKPREFYRQVAERGLGAAEGAVERRFGGVVDGRAVIEDDAQCFHLEAGRMRRALASMMRRVSLQSANLPSSAKGTQRAS